MDEDKAKADAVERGDICDGNHRGPACNDPECWRQVGFYGATPVHIAMDPWADVVHHIEASETETFEPGKTTCGKDAARPPAGSVQGYSLEHNLALTTEPERVSCPQCRDKLAACGEMFAGNVCEKPRGHDGAHTGRLPGPRTTEVCQKRLSNGSICGREKDHGGPHAGVRISG